MQESEEGAGGSQRVAQGGQGNVAVQILGNSNHVSIRLAASPQPPLEIPQLGTTAAVDERFTYAAQRAMFVGRDIELNAVRDFAACDQQLAWWLLGGEAGAGKSRLALQAALSLAPRMRAGFLTRTGLDFDWHAWQPDSPTLLIVDYAEADAVRVGVMIRSLAARTTSLVQPVRVLLLARDVDKHADWLRQFEGRGSERATLTAVRHAPPLILNGLNDDALWEVMRAYAPEAQLPSRQLALASFRSIDPVGRPLFAAFAADALASGRDIRGWDQTHLVRDVLERDEDRRWVPAGVTASEKNLVALATIAGGVAVRQLPELAVNELAFPSSATYVPARVRAVVGSDAREIVRPLEPDVLGELFVLQHLAPAHDADQRRLQQMFILAWQRAPNAFVHFTQRAAHDFPDHPTTRALVQPPTHAPNLLSDWGWSASNRVTMLALRARWEDAEALCEDIARASAMVPASIRLRDDVSSGNLNLAIAGADRQVFDVAERARGKIADLHIKYPHEALHLERLAKVTRNFVVDYADAGRLDDTVRCLNASAALAHARTAHAEVHLQFVRAVTYAIPRLCHAERIAEAQRAMDALCDLSVAGTAAEERQDALVHAVPMLATAHMANRDSAGAAAVYDRLRARSALITDPTRAIVALAGVLDALISGNARLGNQGEAERWWRRLARLAKSRPDVPEVLTAACLAAASCMTFAATARDVDGVERWFMRLDHVATPRLAGEMSPAVGHVDMIAAAWARVRTHCLGGDLNVAKTAYLDLCARADAAASADARRLLANAGTDMVGAYSQRGQCAEARALAEAIEYRALSFSDEVPLAVEVLKAWFNVMICYGQQRRDFGNARRVYDHIAARATLVEAERDARVVWAIAGRSMMKLARNLGILSDPAGVIPVMRALLSRHSDDAAFKEQLAGWV